MDTINRKVGNIDDNKRNEGIFKDSTRRAHNIYETNIWKKYNRKITLRYLDAYMNVRFYNFYIKDENLTFRKNYLNAIKEEEQKILADMPKNKKLIEDMGLFFYYILYFDKISYRVDTEEIVEKLYKIRKRILKKTIQNSKKIFTMHIEYIQIERISF